LKLPGKDAKIVITEKLRHTQERVDLDYIRRRINRRAEIQKEIDEYDVAVLENQSEIDS
jgi:hypothetical protein